MLRISESVIAYSYIAELVLNSLSHATEDEYAIDRDHSVRHQKLVIGRSQQRSQLR